MIIWEPFGYHEFKIVNYYCSFHIFSLCMIKIHAAQPTLTSPGAYRLGALRMQNISDRPASNAKDLAFQRPRSNSFAFGGPKCRIFSILPKIFCIRPSEIQILFAPACPPPLVCFRPPVLFRAPQRKNFAFACIRGSSIQNILYFNIVHANILHRRILDQNILHFI